MLADPPCAEVAADSANARTFGRSTALNALKGLQIDQLHDGFAGLNDLGDLVRCHNEVGPRSVEQAQRAFALPGTQCYLPPFPCAAANRRKHVALYDNPWPMAVNPVLARTIPLPLIRTTGLKLACRPDGVAVMVRGRNGASSSVVDATGQKSLSGSAYPFYYRDDQTSSPFRQRLAGNR